MNAFEGILIAYALLGLCCGIIETTEGYSGESVWFMVGGFLTTLLLWPLWIIIVFKEILNEPPDDSTHT